MSGQENPKNIFEKKRAEGIAAKKKDSLEMVAYGEPHPYTGEYQMRPKHIGVTYDIPPNNGTYCPDQVDQEGVDAVNINNLMAKYDPSGKLFANAITQGFTTEAGLKFDEFIQPVDFQESLNRTIHAQQQFETLPANLRNRFENNPIKFLEYMADKENTEEQYKLGLRVKKEQPAPGATLDDVVKAVRETAKPKKQAPKGDTTSEE